MADLDPEVAQLLLKTKPGRDEHDARTNRYNISYDIYRASEPDAQGVRPWQSKLRVPYGRQVLDTELVNIVTGKPRVVVTPRSPDKEPGAKAMQVLLDYYIDEDNFVAKQPPFVQQGLIYGVTVAKNHWLYQPEKRQTRTFKPDPQNPDRSLSQVETVDVTVRDGPSFEPWSIYFAYWSPGARSVDDADYVVLQAWKSKDELLRSQFDPDTGAGLYSNLQELFDSTQGPKPPDNSQQRFLGLTQTTRYRDKFLIEEIWTDQTVYLLGNRQILLRKMDNPYWHGRKPIVIAQSMPDGFELQGIPETEAIDHLQQALWTTQNMRMDNLHLTVMRGITYREGGVTDPNALELRPRFRWPVSDHDDIRPFEVQPLPPEAYKEEETLLARAQLVTGINPYVSGSDLQTVDQNTATGVTALQEVAGRLLRFKASMFQYRGYQPTFEMWGDMIQQFQDASIVVKILGRGGEARWVEVRPEDVAGHFSYKLEGSEESLSRQQERGEAIALLNAFAPLVQTGIVNMEPILERVAVAYDFPNPEALFPPQQPAGGPVAAPTQQNGQNGQPPFGVMQPRIGAVPMQGQGAVAMDPQLQQALGNTGQQPIGPQQYAQRPYRVF
jgi:hypothetical protein